MQPRQPKGSSDSASPAASAARFAGDSLVCARAGRVVFRDLSFSLDPGEALVLRGGNGSGKSSLLRIMAGLLPPSRGALAWDGDAIADDPEAHRGRILFVGHKDAVKPALTVRENLAFWARVLAPGAADRAAAVNAALSAFGLDPLAGLPAQLLSAGQRRRVALARVAMTPRPLWLLDEPTVGLDAEAVAALEGLIAAHRRRGGAVALATHVDLRLDGARTMRLERFARDGVGSAEPDSWLQL